MFCAILGREKDSDEDDNGPPLAALFFHFPAIKLLYKPPPLKTPNESPQLDPFYGLRFPFPISHFPFPCLIVIL